MRDGLRNAVGGSLIALAILALPEVGLRLVGFEYRPPQPVLILGTPAMHRFDPLPI